MEADHGWDRWRAYDLLTHVGEVSVGHYTIGTVGAKDRQKCVRKPCPPQPPPGRPTPDPRRRPCWWTRTRT